MNTNKLYALFLFVGIIFQSAVAGQTKAPDAKLTELSPELKQSALTLLSEVASETGRHNVAENRIRTGTIAAGLLFEHDEPAARRLFQSVFLELQGLFAEMREPATEMTSTERSKYYFRREKLAAFRHEYLMTLAEHDPQAAGEALAGLQVKLIKDYDPLQPTKLELQLASIIAKRDPARAYALAKTQLAGEGIGYELITTLKDLNKKDPKVARDIAGDVLAKIRSSRIRVPTAIGTPAKPAANSASQKTEIDFWQVANFIGAASELKRKADSDKDRKATPLISDTEMREVVELITNAYLAEPSPSIHTIGQVMPDVIQYSPALVPRIRLKIGAKAFRELETITESASYFQAGIKEKGIDELAQEAAKAPVNMRIQRYVDVIQKAIDQGEPEKAQALAANIVDREGYGFLFERIRLALPLAKAKRGETAEVRKILATLKTDQEKIGALVELASTLAGKGDKESAKALLDEAMEIAMATPINFSGLESAGKVAAVYASVAPEPAFLIAETGIEQMNKYIRAGIMLDEFYDFGSTASGELLFDSANATAVRHVPSSMVLLRDLAKADFKRTVNLAEKFERPDIRSFARLRIAQALLDPKAVEKEKVLHGKVMAGDDEH